MKSCTSGIAFSGEKKKIHVHNENFAEDYFYH